MHQTLQKFFQLVIDRSKGVQASLFNQEETAKQSNKGASLKELLAIYEEVWRDDWFFSATNKQDYKKKGLQILKEFYEIIKKDIPVPLHLEKGFNIKVGDITLRGVIDRIDTTASGQWKIIDYKTGRVKDKLTFDDKKQLLIYKLAGQDVFKEDVSQLAFYYLDENKEVSFEATPEEIKKVRAWITETADQIKSSEFKATPGYHCKSCDFNQICPFAQR